MVKIKKDFWAMLFDPCQGCLNTCPYCYARKIAFQYAEQIAEKELLYYNKYSYSLIEYNSLVERLKAFKPTWLESNYVRKFPSKPSIIFVNSMSDPAYWEREWYEKILKRITENMQHTFVILTKTPEVYKKFTFPHNTILGITCTNQKMLDDFAETLNNSFWDNCYNSLLLSIEPIQQKIDINMFLKVDGSSYIDWIHVGQESGNRKNRVRATPEMIQPFYDLDIPVFMKNNLRGICSDELRKEFPSYEQ